MATVQWQRDGYVFTSSDRGYRRSTVATGTTTAGCAPILKTGAWGVLWGKSRGLLRMDDFGTLVQVSK